MSRKNFGILKNQMLGTLIESLSRDGYDATVTTETLEFTDVVKNDVFLKLESLFYGHLETKAINNENSAARYIDDCVSLFEGFSKADYVTAHKKLDQFGLAESHLYTSMVDNTNTSLQKLYENIDILLYESLAISDDLITDVDVFHESFEYVLNHVKSNQKPVIKESKFDKLKSFFTKEEILKKSVENFNMKYSLMSEDERKVLAAIISNKNEDKQLMFESLKEESSRLLVSKLASSTNEMISEKIKKSIDKINSMTYNEKTANTDILNIHNLKSNMKG